MEGEGVVVFVIKRYENYVEMGGSHVGALSNAGKKFHKTYLSAVVAFPHCSLKKSTEEHFNRLKVFLLYLMTHTISVSGKKHLVEVWLIHAEQMSLKNFIIS